MRVFNPDRFFKRRTIISSENFGPADQNFQDQNSRDRSTEMTICRYSLFLSPKFVLYWAAKACKRFTIPHKLPFDCFYMCIIHGKPRPK